MTDKKDHELPFEPFLLKKHSPFYRFVAVLAIIALILLSIRGYFYLFHPEPRMKLVLADVQKFLPSDFEEPFTSHRPEQVKEVVSFSADTIKQVANAIAASSCRTSDRVCQSKALYYFVRDQITYVPDPEFHDQLENPLTVLKTGGADCEDMAVLLVALQKAIGNQARLVFVPGHAYAQVKIPQYKDKWLNMEGTCKTCTFNEVPTDTLIQEKTFAEI
ncbi:transglutaminase domain-containing protein [Candidatus Peregrinibacteria bacterium]|nr:transglutaminase domain-containing protein [Candidatus Peregrinibacteria bacterium]